MCEHHHIDRRGFGSLALAAAGMLLVPAAAHAAKIRALAVTCIDYRFFNKDAAFVANELNLFKDADNVALAGAALAGVSNVFVKSKDAFWEQLGIAKKLHSIDTVVLIDHMECGAYNAEFGKPDKPLTPAEEHAKHVEVIHAMAKLLHAQGYAVEGYLMPANLRDCVEQIVIPK